jgi:hypothetical protein
MEFPNGYATKDILIAVTPLESGLELVETRMEAESGTVSVSGEITTSGKKLILFQVDVWSHFMR